MPILELISDDEPLSQGDILKGIRLFATDSTASQDGTSATAIVEDICVVVSRPCNAIRRQSVIVAPVRQYNPGVPSDIISFDHVLSFLTDTRDGVSSPDVFYLGNLPDRDGRYAAKFESLHTLIVPVEESERQEFVASHRIARLSIEFARDLHLRLFRSFASLGFNDHGWMSDQDLEWVVEKGKSARAEAERVLHDVRAADQQKQFSGKSIPPQQIESAEKKLKEINDKLAPYESEQAKRQNGGSDQAIHS